MALDSPGHPADLTVGAGVVDDTTQRVTLATDDLVPVGAIITGTTVRNLRADAATNVLTTITYPHHEIHAGTLFTAQVTDTVVGDTERVILAFKTPASTSWMHMVVGFSSLVASHLTVHETATWTTSTGAIVPVFNRNRNSANTSAVRGDQTGAFVANQIASGVTAADSFAADLTIYTRYTWGIKQTGASPVRSSEEIMLKQDTTYLVMVTSDAAANKVQLWLNWYEHTDRG